MENTRSFSKYILPSLIASGVYILFCSLYISVSGKIAKHFSTSLEQLARIEKIKGIAFIILTGFTLFWIMVILLRRVWKQHSQITEQLRVINDQRTLIATSERRALSGTFAASIAHDINNVLGYALYNISELSETVNLSDTSVKNLQNIGNAFTKIELMSKNLMEIGRKNVQSSITEFDLSKVVSDSVEMGKMHTRVRTRKLRVEIKNSPIIINSNPHVIEQCILNLLLNAADATESVEGIIQLNLYLDSNNAIIEVHDNGPGIPESERENVFKAFHTTKENGTGLGLAGVKASIEILCGKVDVGTSPLGGALLKITVPVLSPIQV